MIKDAIVQALNNGFNPFYMGHDCKYINYDIIGYDQNVRFKFEYRYDDCHDFLDDGFIWLEYLIFSTDFIDKLTGIHERCSCCGRNPRENRQNYYIGKDCKPIYRKNASGGHYSCCQGAVFIDGASQIRKELANMSTDNRIIYLKNLT